MDFLFINTHELSALTGLPHIQQLTYLVGIRPYMDRKCFIVGIKRKISYQSLSEALYVEPHPGIQSGSPSKQQLRRVIKGLEQAGLVAIQSTAKHLVLKCLLADTHDSDQNKPDTKPASHADISFISRSLAKSKPAEEKANKSGRGEITKADIPHNSEEKHVCVDAHFNHFWSLYPQKVAKQNAREAFQKLNPSDQLLTQLLTALQQQIDAYDVLQNQGRWVPKWKFPANWLVQQCWEDEIDTNLNQETKHAIHATHHSAKQFIDPLWESCKSGALRVSNGIA